MEELKYDFTGLPNETIEKILFKLPPKDLTRACSVNKELVNICATEHFISKYYKKYKKEIERRRLVKPKTKDEIVKIIRGAVRTGDAKLYKKWMNYPGWDPLDHNNFPLLVKAFMDGHSGIGKLFITDPRVGEKMKARMMERFPNLV